VKEKRKSLFGVALEMADQAVLVFFERIFMLKMVVECIEMDGCALISVGMTI